MARFRTRLSSHIVRFGRLPRRWLIATLILIVSLAVPAMVSAQCNIVGSGFQCSGNVGAVTLDGDGNNNAFVFVDDNVTGSVTIVSGGGIDTLAFSGFVGGFSINLSLTTSQTVITGLTITLVGFDNAGQAYQVAGGGGSDIITGGAGNDFITGGAGDDSISSGAGNDSVGGGAGDDELIGGAGDDVLEGDDGDDTINGGTGNDILLGDAFLGGTGDDTLDGGAGDDTINAGAGDDLVNGGTGADTINGGAGNDSRTDTNVADCASETMTNVEVDNCVAVTPPPPAPAAAPANPNLECVSVGSRIGLNGRGMVEIFSDFGPHNPNGMIITEISLRSVRRVTDEEKARGDVVVLVVKNSEYAPGWSAVLYWKGEQYGVQVFNGGTLVDDTGPFCGAF